MYSYRVALTTDAEKIQNFCRDHGVNPPDGTWAMVFLAEDSLGNIYGVSGIKSIVQVEPVVGDMPHVVQILAEKAMGFASGFTRSVVAVVNEKYNGYIETLEKCGWTITDTGMTILKREV